MLQEGIRRVGVSKRLEVFVGKIEVVDGESEGSKGVGE